MKRTFLMIVSIILVFSLCACGSQDTPAETVPVTTEVTTPPTEETVLETTVPVETEPTLYFSVTTDAKLEADNLTATLDNNRLSVTLSGLTIEDSYITNQASTRQNAAEYNWQVRFYQDDLSFMLSTVNYAFQPGTEESKSITDFTHFISRMEQDNSSESQYICWHELMVPEQGWAWVTVDFSNTSDSITWTVTLPDQYIDMTFDEVMAQQQTGTGDLIVKDFSFDLASVEQIEVLIQDIPNQYSEFRSYSPGK